MRRGRQHPQFLQVKNFTIITPEFIYMLKKIINFTKLELTFTLNHYCYDDTNNEIFLGFFQFLSEKKNKQDFGI